MLIRKIWIILYCCGELLAFTEKPWFAEPYSCEGFLSYAYQYYPSIADQVGPKYHSNNNYVQGDVSFAFFDRLDVEAEVQLDATTMRSFGFESVALQVRKGILSDLEGDFLSLVVGGNFRYVPNNRLADPSTPYHEVANFEANLSIGREWNDYFDWNYRTWCLFAIGEANKGYPWIRIDYRFEGKIEEKWEWALLAIGYFGTGHHKTIDVDTFKGYYNIAHQSIDLGASASYLLGFWGKLSLTGSYRVYAQIYPKNAATLMLSYTIPFSFF